MTQTRIDRVLWYIAGLLAVIALMLGLNSVGQKAFGSQTVSGPACQTAPATSTLNYMTFGTGTTTLPCNFGLGVDKVYLKVQFSGSSTLSQLIINQANSRNNIDFYPQNLASTTNTANIVDIAPIKSFQLQYASSTDAEFMADGNIMTRLIELEAPDQYTRITFSLASSTSPGIRNGAIWAQLVGKDEL